MSTNDWRPGSNLETLQARARLLADVRAYFAQQNVLEVETPLLASSAATEPSIEPLTTRYQGPGYADGLKLYLQTSPEFAMKRLLSANSVPIYQICKAFRDGEAGRKHNLEFTLLEWYRPGFDLEQLMQEVADIARLGLRLSNVTTEILPYAELFQTYLDVDVFSTDRDGLQSIAVDNFILGADGIDMDKDAWLDLLMSYLIEPQLGQDRLSFVTDYPASQASLARLNKDGRTAARFELYYKGIELANGFHELSDSAEQSQRFESENCKRRSNDQAAIRVDKHFLSALESGLPDCSGVALGLDRLLMLSLDTDDIDQVLAFSLPRI